MLTRIGHPDFIIKGDMKIEGHTTIGMGTGIIDISHDLDIATAVDLVIEAEVDQGHGIDLEVDQGHDIDLEAGQGHMIDPDAEHDLVIGQEVDQNLGTDLKVGRHQDHNTLQ